MFKRIAGRVGALLGTAPARDMPEPVYRVISDGLLITASGAEAWFVISTSGTDLMSEDDLDRELDTVVHSVSAALKDVWCHLRVLWTVTSGAEYTESMAGYYTAGNWQEWLRLRAEHIDQVAPPRRVLLLGVALTDEKQHDVSELERITAPVTGIEQHRVSRKDYAMYAGQAKKLRGQLERTPLKAQLAPVETIAWAIGREQYGYAAPVPADGIVAGANLAELTAGRVVPLPDYLAVYDRAGQVSSYRQVLPVVKLPHEIEAPGEGSWLLDLMEITRITDAGDEVQVLPEVSIRFKILSRTESLKLAEQARTQAKEQRMSAVKHSAGETSVEIEESEAIAEGLKKEITRDGTLFIRSHPRLIVEADTLTDLRANADAVTSFYSDRGIPVVSGTDEQRELWLETLPGDRLRVEDLGRITEGYGFFNSLFWGGSMLGVGRGPAIGQITGSTSGLARCDVAGLAKAGHPTTIGYFGNSGQGKTTAMLLMLLEAVFAGGWGLLWDWKGDTAGAVAVAEEFGLPTKLMRFGPEHAGAIDLFRALPLDKAPLAVSRQLTLLASTRHRPVAEDAALAAANEVARHSDPTTWKVIQRLVADRVPAVSAFGQSMVEMAQTGIGRVLLAEPSGASLLTDAPGLWVLQMPGMNMPKRDSLPKNWDPDHRLSLAALRAVTTYGLHVSSSQHLRERPKIIAVPEVHYVLRTGDGTDFIDTVARTGRAFGTMLLLDSQDITGVAAVEGIAEQLISVFGFNLVTRTQQDATAEFLGMEPSEWTRHLIGSLGPDLHVGDATSTRTSRDTEEGTANVKGDCFYRDKTGRVAHIKIDLPHPDIQALLDTAPRNETDTKEAA